MVNRVDGFTATVLLHDRLRDQLFIRQAVLVVLALVRRQFDIDVVRVLRGKLADRTLVARAHLVEAGIRSLVLARCLQDLRGLRLPVLENVRCALHRLAYQGRLQTVAVGVDGRSVLGQVTIADSGDELILI